MQTTTPALANPFALLMDPQGVFAMIEKSARLEGLQRRICRPLDKPLIPRTAVAEGEPVEIDDNEFDASDIDESAPLDAAEI